MAAVVRGRNREKSAVSVRSHGFTNISVAQLGVWLFSFLLAAHGCVPLNGLPHVHTQNACVCRHTARHREKASPSHAKSRDCVSASGLLPKGGGEKKFRRGMGSQVPSLKLGGGKIRERQSDQQKGERVREGLSAL